VRPDLCLIATFLVGFLVGEFDGVMMGIALGFVQDLFSGGDSGLNLITKGLIGLLAGMAGQHLANATTVAVLALLLSASVVSGFVFVMWAWSGEGLSDAMAFVQSVLLPHALYDAGLGAAIYWLIAGRRGEPRAFEEERVPFGR
jgi:cell shape-determining protein MreD